MRTTDRAFAQTLARRFARIAPDLRRDCPAGSVPDLADALYAHLEALRTQPKLGAALTDAAGRIMQANLGDGRAARGPRPTHALVGSPARQPAAGPIHRTGPEWPFSIRPPENFSSFDAAFPVKAPQRPLQGRQPRL
jgi:hypothetical protein